MLAPIHIIGRYSISLSATQFLALAVIALLTFANTRGLNYGRMLQNIFTVAKIGALIALIVLGCTIGIHHAAVAQNFHRFWAVRHPMPFEPDVQEDCPHLRKRYWGQHLWARGHFRDGGRGG